MSEAALVAAVSELQKAKTTMSNTIDQLTAEKAQLIKKCSDLNAQVTTLIAENCDLRRSLAPAQPDDSAQEVTEFWKKLIEQHGDDAAEWRKAYDQLKRLTTVRDVFWPAPRPTKKPSSYLALPFFIWAPLRQGVAEICCPSCNNHCSPLKLSQPRRVYDVAGSLFYMAEIYQCQKQGCRKSVVGDDPDLMKTFPLAVQASYPIVKTRKAGITKQLETLIMFMATSGSNSSELTKLLSELYASAYQRRVLLYLSATADSKDLFDERMKNMQGFHFDSRVIETLPAAPTENWTAPSVDHITDLTKELLSLRAKEQDAYMQSLGARIMAMDHTFKAARHIWIGSETPFRSIFTVFNEYGEVILCVHTRNESFDTLFAALHNLAQRAACRPFIIYVDNCCTVRAKLQQHFPDAIILLDLWHFENRFMRCFPTVQTVRQRQFLADLRAILLVPVSPVEGKKARLHAWEKKIPAPEVLVTGLERLAEKYTDVISSNQKLNTLWPTAMQHAKDGCLSDPPQVCLVRTDKYGVSRSDRGTNIAESHHSRLRSKTLLRGKTSADFNDALARSFSYRNNVRCAIRFRNAPELGVCDPLIMRSLTNLWMYIFKHNNQRLLTNPYSLCPIATAPPSSELFFSTYVHPLPCSLQPLSDSTWFESCEKRVFDAIGVHVSVAVEGQVDFNWQLSMDGCTFADRLVFVGVGDDLSLCGCMEKLHRLVDEEQDEQEEQEEEPPLDSLVSYLTKKHDPDDVTAKVPLYPLCQSAADFLRCPIVVVHAMSSQAILVQPSRPPGSVSREAILGILIRKDNQFVALLVSPPSALVGIQQELEEKELTPSYEQCTAPQPLVLPAAVSTSGDLSVRQNNIITKFSTPEMELLLQLVQKWMEKNPKAKSTKWEAILSTFSDEVRKAEKTASDKGAEPTLRFPRDANQLRVGFQNRLIHKGAAEAVKQFESWKATAKVQDTPAAKDKRGEAPPPSAEQKKSDEKPEDKDAPQPAPQQQLATEELKPAEPPKKRSRHEKKKEHEMQPFQHPFLTGTKVYYLRMVCEVAEPPVKKDGTWWYSLIDVEKEVPQEEVFCSPQKGVTYITPKEAIRIRAERKVEPKGKGKK